MKKVIFVLTFLAAAFFSQSTVQSQTDPQADIQKLIFSYRDALNASDANQVVALFTADGVLLPNAAPTAVGTDQIKGTYQYVFANFTYNLAFTIGEIVVNGDYAYARSTSKGSYVVKASGQTVSDENRELFVFQKVNGVWKIARYMYNQEK